MAILLPGMLLLVKLWGWMQMNRHAIQRDVKRFELLILERGEKWGRHCPQCA
jgi:hypothetical protein